MYEVYKHSITCTFVGLQGLPDIQEIGFLSEKLILVKPAKKNYGVVGLDRDDYICHVCSFGRHSCHHVLCLKDLIKSSDDETLPNFLLAFILSHDQLRNSVMKKRVPRCYSRQLITWKTTKQQQKIHNLSLENAETVLNNGTMALIPPDNPCPRCNGDMSNVEVFDPDTKRLFLLARVIPVTGMFALLWYSCKETLWKNYYASKHQESPRHTF